MRSSSTSPDPRTRPHPYSVGNSFVKQYYHLLAKSPQDLHRFYKDESCFSRADANQYEEAISGQKAINDKILSLGYKNAQVDIESGSVDCQASHDGGVIVMVTGLLTLKKDKQPRPFVQTFFLAVQPNGFFVLNDTFRYLDVNMLLNEIKANESVVNYRCTGTETENILSPKHEIVICEKLSSTTSPRQAQMEKHIRSPKSSLHQVERVAGNSIDDMTAMNRTAPQSEMKSPQMAGENVVSSPKKSSAYSSPRSHEMTSPKRGHTQISSPLDEDKALTNERPEISVNHVTSPCLTQKSNKGNTDTYEGVMESPKKGNKKHPSPRSPRRMAEMSQGGETEDVSSQKPTTGPTTWASRLFATKNISFMPTTISASPQITDTPNSQVISPPVSSGAAAPSSAVTSAHKIQSVSMIKGDKLQPILDRSASLYIRNLPMQTTVDDLYNLFKSYGEIANVNLNIPRNYAFIDYTHVESMKSAVNDNRQFIIYGTVLYVEERNAEKKKSKEIRGRGRDRASQSGGGRGGGKSYDITGEDRHDRESKRHDGGGPRSGARQQQNTGGNDNRQTNGKRAYGGGNIKAESGNRQ